MLHSSPTEALASPPNHAATGCMTTGSSQVWFVTGSSHGLGRSIADAALAGGHRVAATARDARALDDLVAAHGDQVIALALDPGDPRQVVAAIRAAVDAFGRIDVVVNDAGYADIDTIGSTDLWGVAHVTRAALPVLRDQRHGQLVQVCSIGVAATEPEGTRTGWAGSSMTIHEVRDDDQGSVRVEWKLLEEKGPGTTARDPSDMAHAIVTTLH